MLAKFMDVDHDYDLPFAKGFVAADRFCWP